jgi:hypothetical protein
VNAQINELTGSLWIIYRPHKDGDISGTAATDETWGADSNSSKAWGDHRIEFFGFIPLDKAIKTKYKSEGF